MEKISRRKFSQNAALAVAAGSVAVAAITPKVLATTKDKAKYPVVLYRETEAWKKYYKTL